MSDKYQTALLLALKPSKRLKKMVILVHTLALGASMVNALILAIKISLCVLICLHCWLTFRRLNSEKYTIKYTESMGWELAADRDFISVDILKSTVITTFALFLHFKYANQAQSWNFKNKKSLLILSDTLNEENYRSLIVKLKTTASK